MDCGPCVDCEDCGVCGVDARGGVRVGARGGVCVCVCVCVCVELMIDRTE